MAALWFKTSRFGDEKDRVVVRGNGLTTYFASDIAYHKDKLERGFHRIIDIWRADEQELVLPGDGRGFAGGMQRRALFGGNNPKDRLAEAVANVTGIDDSADSGAVFRHYP